VIGTISPQGMHVSGGWSPTSRKRDLG